MAHSSSSSSSSSSFSSVMALVVLLLLLGAAAPTHAGQVPGPASAANLAISSRDRLYLAGQTSGAVSVVDPASGSLLGLIQLGAALPDTLSAVYRGQSLVHGMGFSPDHATLAVVCVGSNAVAFVDTASNKVKHIAYVGRAPHEAFWTPDGKEVWVVVRGQDYIQVLDGSTYEPTRRIQVPQGPGMVIFSPKGDLAYICSSFSPETVVVSVATGRIVGRVKQASTFCPNIAASPDGTQVWMTLKDSGKVQVFSAKAPFQPLALLETGAITNHVNFAINPKGEQLAYVTVGGLRQVKVFSTSTSGPKLVATIDDVGDNPHGLWPSGDGARMFVGLQLANAVAEIDTSSNRVVRTIDTGAQAPMAVVYVPQAAPAAAASSSGARDPAAAANLMPAAEALAANPALHLGLVAAGGKQEQARTATAVAVNGQGLTDSLEAAVTGLTPGQRYVLALASSRDGSGDLQPLASFVGGKDGAASVAVLGPFRSMLMGGGAAARPGGALRVGVDSQARFLVVAPQTGLGQNARYESPVQVQRAV